MDFGDSYVREIDTVSLEEQTSRKFAELNTLQLILKRLKHNLRQKDKNYDKYKRFYDNILKIIKYKLNEESITRDGGRLENVDYKLINQNNIIINGERLVLSDLDHEDHHGDREKQGKPDEAGAKEELKGLMVVNGKRVVKLEEEMYIPLEYYKRLYSHQKKGLRWLSKLHRGNLGGILADDMGLGKTITILSLLNSLIYSLDVNNQLENMPPLSGLSRTEEAQSSNMYEGMSDQTMGKGEREPLRVLIVTNVTLIEQWKTEINKWIFTEVKLYILHTNYDIEYNHYEARQRGEKPNFLIYLIGYEYLRINIEYINNYEWYYLILDEGQKIRNPNSLITLSLKTIKTPHRVILSGSPIQNNLIELWSLMDFILPNYLGSLASFIEEFVFPITSVNSNNRLNNKQLDKLRLLVLPYIFRTTKNNKRRKNDGENEFNNEGQDLFKTELTDPGSEVSTMGTDRGSVNTDEKTPSLLGTDSDRMSMDNDKSGNSDKCRVEEEALFSEEERIEPEEEAKNMEEVDLPNKIERIILCNLTMEQYKLYVEVLNKYKYRERTRRDKKLTREVRRIIGKELTRDKNILKIISVLRKICNHPRLLNQVEYENNHLYNNNTEIPLKEEEEKKEKEESKRNVKGERKPFKTDRHEIKYNETKKNTSTKLNVSMKIIDIWRKQNNKILVFTQTISMLSIIEEELLEKYQKETILILHGKIKTSIRNKIIEKFTKDKKIFIMLLTTKVGGIGLNLTAATRIIIFDPDWNPMTDLQARERSYRIGQKREVIIYRLITANTIEEKIYQRQLYKCYLTQKVLNNYHLSFFNKYINNLHYLLSYPPPPYPVTINTKEKGAKQNKDLKGMREPIADRESSPESKRENSREDETYKMLIKEDDSGNINSYIKYNDIEDYTNNTNHSEFTYESLLTINNRTPALKSNINDQANRNNELLNNLRFRNTKNTKYILTNQILHYFNKNRRQKITTNDVSSTPNKLANLTNFQLVKHFQPLVPDEYSKQFKKILKELCVTVKKDNIHHWRLMPKYENVLPS